MKNEELLSGENINIEYKRELPEKSLRYVKTVVAFANGNGGHIVFGVENQEVTIITDQVTDKVTDKVGDKDSVKVFHRFKSLIISINSENLERKEIMQRMGLNHISFFIDTYLTPAINQGYVAMLYPDKPRHPKQKYYLTEKGRELLKTLQTQS